MTASDGAEHAELDPQPTSDDATTDDATTDDATTGDETTGINQEQAEELAAADYQTRLEEFDNVDSTPVVSVPAPGEPGAVEMPKPQ